MTFWFSIVFMFGLGSMLAGFLWRRFLERLGRKQALRRVSRWFGKSDGAAYPD